jgi:peptidoglycan/LPS O-acetylase OafA/YrhL
MEAATSDAVLIEEGGDASQVLVETTPPQRVRAAYYLPQLDMLRFVGFLAVFLNHTFPHNPDVFVQIGAPRAIARLLVAIIAGPFGVDLFFVLTSYLITTLLLREVDLRGRVDLGRFYLRRSLRIWPLYFLFIALCFFFQKYIPGAHMKGAEVVPFLYFFGNYMVIRNPRIFISHLWSVSVQEQFYLVWAFILRWVKVSRLPLLATLAILLTVGTRLIMFYRNAPISFFWVSTLTRLDPLALGVLLACGSIFARELRRRWLWLLGAIVLLVGGELLMPVAHKTAISLTVGYFVAALGSAMIVKLTIGTRLALGRLARATAYLGKISYGLYVWHWVSIRFVGHWLPGIQLSRYMVRASVGLAISILVAVVSYECFEKWFMNLKNRFAYVASHPV